MKMTTSSATNQHPFDLLEAYALDALELEEELAVIEHLDWCDHCSGIVDANLQVVLALSENIPLESPPEGLRERLLASVDPPAGPASPVSVSVSRRSPPRSWSRVSWAAGSRWARLAVPAGAALAIALVALTIVLNVQIAGDLDNLQSENARLQNRLDQSMATTAAVASSSASVSQIQGNLQRWQQTSYALAQPGNQTLVMQPARADVEARGVLVASEDGSNGVLMVSGLLPPQPDSVYHVWLMQGGQRHWAGEMDVDERGWGTMALIPPNPLASYDSVQLSRGMGVAAVMSVPAGTTQRTQATANMVGDMVLVASLH